MSQPSSTFVGPKAADSGSPIQRAWQQTIIKVSILRGSVIVDGGGVVVDVGEGIRRRLFSVPRVLSLDSDFVESRKLVFGDVLP